MTSETNALMRNQRIISGIFMFVLLALNITLNYYSFNIQSSLSSLQDKSNSSIQSYINAFNSWDISLIAIAIFIVVITILGIIFSPYLIIGFLFLYLLVLIALFVYTSIILNAILGTSDYQSYKTNCAGSTIPNCQSIINNVQQAFTAVIVIMIICGLMILGIILFLYFMIRSLTKAGGLEAELDYIIGKFSPSETDKLNEEIQQQQLLINPNDPNVQKYLTLLAAQQEEQEEEEEEEEEDSSKKKKKNKAKERKEEEEQEEEEEVKSESGNKTPAKTPRQKKQVQISKNQPQVFEFQIGNQKFTATATPSIQRRQNK